MREIKFRAWDKITKKYFYSGTLDNGDVLVIHLDGEIEISSDDAYKPEDFIIEQFTGLRDKIGREIYEGDIIQRFNTDRGVFVIWDGASFEYSDPTSYCISLSRFHKVIGNIHENPELLP